MIEAVYKNPCVYFVGNAKVNTDTICNEMQNGVLAYKYQETLSYLKGLTEVKQLLFRGADLTFYGELRKYQEEAVNAFMEKKHGILQLPTGAGKTVIALYIASLLKKSTLVVVNTTDQAYQWGEMVKKFLGTEPGFFYTSRKDTDKDIVITTYRSSGKIKEAFGFVIYDEVHHLPAETFIYAYRNQPTPLKLGLSATPERSDNTPQPMPVLFSLTYNDIRNYIAQLEIKHIPLQFTENEYRLYNNLITEIERAGGTKVLFSKNMPFKAKKLMAMWVKIKKILSLSYQKQKFVYDFDFQGKKSIVFCTYKDEAEVYYKLIHHKDKMLLTSDVKQKERTNVLAKFNVTREGVLVVTPLGDEGIDIPSADTGIIISGNNTPRQMIQRVGRILRMNGNKKSVLYNLYIRGSIEEKRVLNFEKEINS